jgi:hypothetical protein
MTKRKIIPASELILHDDNSVYHLKIKPENLTLIKLNSKVKTGK